MSTKIRLIGLLIFASNIVLFLPFHGYQHMDVVFPSPFMLILLKNQSLQRKEKKSIMK